MYFDSPEQSINKINWNLIINSIIFIVFYKNFYFAQIK